MKTLQKARLAPAVGARRVVLALSGMAALLVGGGALSAATQQDPEAEPSAIVEDIKAASVTDVDFMDFLYEGMEIELADDESLTLSYLASCRIEEITGGKVTVGKLKSEVSSPIPIVVTAVDCDGGGIVPTERQGEDVAAITFRQGPMSDEDPVRINSTTPLFAFSEPVDELTVEPVDESMAPLKVSVGGTRLDFIEKNLSLKPGLVYRATTGEQSVLIRIAPNASRHGNSLVERLIAF